MNAQEAFKKSKEHQAILIELRKEEELQRIEKQRQIEIKDKQDWENRSRVTIQNNIEASCKKAEYSAIFYVTTDNWNIESFKYFQELKNIISWLNEDGFKTELYVRDEKVSSGFGNFDNEDTVRTDHNTYLNISWFFKGN